MVEFAHEVSEANAMDGTVNKLEQMFWESPATGPRRGTSPTTINSWGNPKKQEVGVYMYMHDIVGE